jgi:hypothetical protein
MTVAADFAHTGTNFGVCNHAVHAQFAHVADPTTDTTELMNAIKSILLTLEGFGFHASS